MSNVKSSYHCDKEFLIKPMKDIPEIVNWNYNKSQMNNEKTFDMRISDILDPFVNPYCFNHEDVPDVIYNLRSILIQDESQNIVVTNVMGEQQFVCHNFTGNCSYQLYDLAGRLIASGNTVNEQNNKIPDVSKGIYILNVVDDSHTIVSKKIVVQ